MGQLASIEPTWHLFRCSSQCDPGGEGCIASGTVTKEYGAITCSATDDKATVGAKHGDLRRGGGFEGYVMSTEPGIGRSSRAVSSPRPRGAVAGAASCERSLNALACVVVPCSPTPPPPASSYNAALYTPRAISIF